MARASNDVPAALAGYDDGRNRLSTIMLMHDRLAMSMMLFMAAIGIWGMFMYFTGGGLTGSFNGALAIGEVLIIAQVAFGVILYFKGFRPESSIHILYGLTAVIALPFIWSYMRERDARQALLIFSLGALFVSGLAIRGMTTGS
ncbi:MAG: hypothetical protein R2848_06915 [Thermomicrobiales bacterium]